MPCYRGEDVNSFKISGFGFIEDYGEKNSLQIQLKEEGQRTPMLYQVWLMVTEKGGQNQEINLGSFKSAEEQIIKWQTVFSSQDLGINSCSLEQVSSITIKGISEDVNSQANQQNICFVSNQLGNPEIEIILEEDDLEKILQPTAEKTTALMTQEIIETPIIEEEIVEDLQSEDRVPESQEKAEWEKLLEKILTEPEEEITVEEMVKKEEKKVWKMPEPLNKQEVILEAPKLKITYN